MIQVFCMNSSQHSEGTTVLQNVKKYSPNDMTLHTTHHIVSKLIRLLSEQSLAHKPEKLNKTHNTNNERSTTNLHKGTYPRLEEWYPMATYV
jgi:hypothetical protein